MSQGKSVRWYWEAPQMWKGETAYIVGGGASLKGMDWSRLEGRCVIGCNDAYKLGPKIVKCAYFGDLNWWRIHHWVALRQFKGLKVTCAPEYIREQDIYPLQRKPRKICKAPSVGWFNSTGASAVNLAIILGAKKVVLLGFDMKLTNGDSNWYVNLKNKPDASVYPRFIQGFEMLRSDLKDTWLDVEVVNANPDSAMDVFPKVKLEDVL